MIHLDFSTEAPSCKCKKNIFFVKNDTFFEKICYNEREKYGGERQDENNTL